MDVTDFSRLFRRPSRPVAKSAIKPIGMLRNPAERAVNPLIVKGLMIG